ncbi:MAG: MmcQ/YjbR family DNA-binding protein [Gammaproteobacteria bacterium]|nr:MmcQ/YjbR family DNA-binding protein [Gammaproteobacteria bacterium]NNC97801.1 MmcQ/YjbR family DNA-binding protein [Gammaproteobacteria bacterium]NNM13728.1 MmcQ/YjbR family DNA-binding protein [Gammaproteobacteria bacterium]
MKYKAAHNYLIKKPEAKEDYPFGPDVAVYKVKGKMFATLAYSLIENAGKKVKQARMNLKCDPDQALMLRKIFPAVILGYHMNKRHWNTVCLDGSVPPNEIKAMIDHSYALVVKSLKATVKNELKLKYGSQHFDL